MILQGYDTDIHDGSYYYDEHRAEKPVRFIEHYCSHVTGPLAGKKWKLEEWQKNIVRAFIGWRRKKDDGPRYRYCILALPRGNSKSMLAAALAAYKSCFDGNRGAQCYVTAGTKDQAGETFRYLAGMIRQGKLRKKLEVKDTRSTVLYRAGNSFIRTIAPDRDQANGLTPTFIVCDELHVWEGTWGREFFNCLESGMPKNPNSQMFCISTAGYSRETIFWDLFSRAKLIRDNPEIDYTTLPVIYAADEAANWTDPGVWESCNPNWCILLH